MFVKATGARAPLCVHAVPHLLRTLSTTGPSPRRAAGSREGLQQHCQPPGVCQPTCTCVCSLLHVLTYSVGALCLLLLASSHEADAKKIVWVPFPGSVSHHMLAAKVRALRLGVRRVGREGRRERRRREGGEEEEREPHPPPD